VKIKNRSRKRSYELDGIRVGRIGTFQFSSDSAYDSVACDLVKTRLSESEAEAGKDKPITVLVPTLCDWFSSCASAHDSDNLVFIVSDGSVSAIGDSAYDSVV